MYLLIYSIQYKYIYIIATGGSRYSPTTDNKTRMFFTPVAKKMLCPVCTRIVDECEGFKFANRILRKKRLLTMLRRSGSAREDCLLLILVVACLGQWKHWGTAGHKPCLHAIGGRMDRQRDSYHEHPSVKRANYQIISINTSISCGERTGSTA